MGDALLAEATEALRGIIRRQPDDVSRAVAAHLIASRWRELMPTLVSERREAWGTLRQQGWSRTDLSHYMHLSNQRIAQVLDGIDRPEAGQ